LHVALLPPYDCYDMTDADPDWLVQPESGFHALMAGDQLIGFRSFGPTDKYLDGTMTTRHSTPAEDCAPN
jgi:hypothetical protein